MLSSMTGYGRSDFTLGGEGFSMEVKSLNHRYLDMNIRTPDRFFPLEVKMRECIKKRFSRGSFSLYISQRGYGKAGLRPNIALARAYVEAAKSLKKSLGLKGDVDMEFVLRLKDIFIAQGGVLDAERDWKMLEGVLKKALDELASMRKREGQGLKRDIEKRLKNVGRLKEKVEKAVPAVLARYRERLKKEMGVLVGEGRFESAIASEAAVFAERADVTEELVRLTGHIGQFCLYLGLSEPVGRKLDFLCQEIGREVNTIGSKSQDVKITQTVVEMKAELERIREQVQNIE